MIKSGLQNESFIQRIKESGSLALKGKNESGVNVFSGSVTDDGVISGRLIRPKYNINELREAVDLEITELIPQQEPSVGSFVTRSLYEEEQAINADLTEQVQNQSERITSLSGKVEELHAVTQSLNVEIDGLELTNESVDRQLSTTQESFSQINIDLQTAIQNSTQESIERVSLRARNESLQQEIEGLREQLFGRTSQISAGAQSTGNLITVNPTPNNDRSRPRFYGEQDYDVGGWGKNFKRNKEIEVINGREASVLNFSDEEVTVRVNKEDSEWFSISPTTATIAPNETFKFKINTIKDWTRGKYSNSKTGTITFTATSSEEEQTEVFGTEINRSR